MELFSPGTTVVVKSLQTGSYAWGVAGTSHDITLTAVDPDRCMVIVTNYSAAAHEGQRPAGEMIDATTLRLWRQNSGVAITAYYQVVEFA